MLTIKPSSSLSHILRLSLCAMVSIAGFWCPFIISYQYAEYDHRIGGVVLLALPFLVMAAIFSVILLYRLIRGLKGIEVRRRYIIGFIGVLIAAPSIFAALYVCFSMWWLFRMTPMY